MRINLVASTTITVAALSGCVVSPTPYQSRSDAAVSLFGYQSFKVEESLIRVEFQGNARTSSKTVQAYAIYRVAQIASESAAPAFSLLEGEFDRQILEESEKFSGSDAEHIGLLEDFFVSHPERGDGVADAVVGSENSSMVRTRSRSVPMYVPTFIYMPTAPIVLPSRSLLVRLLPAIPTEMNDRVFVTRQVLDRLGPRVKRPNAE